MPERIGIKTVSGGSCACVPGQLPAYAEGGKDSTRRREYLWVVCAEDTMRTSLDTSPGVLHRVPARIPHCRCYLANDPTEYARPLIPTLIKRADYVSFPYSVHPHLNTTDLG
jgi:hypothetical protein